MSKYSHRDLPIFRHPPTHARPFTLRIQTSEAPLAAAKTLLVSSVFPGLCSEKARDGGSGEGRVLSRERGKGVLE